MTTKAAVILRAGIHCCDAHRSNDQETGIQILIKRIPESGDSGMLY